MKGGDDINKIFITFFVLYVFILYVVSCIVVNTYAISKETIPIKTINQDIEEDSLLYLNVTKSEPTLSNILNPNYQIIISGKTNPKDEYTLIGYELDNKYYILEDTINYIQDIDNSVGDFKKFIFYGNIIWVTINILLVYLFRDSFKSKDINQVFNLIKYMIIVSLLFLSSYLIYYCNLF